MMLPRKIELGKIDDRTWACIGDLGENLRKQGSVLNGALSGSRGNLVWHMIFI